MKNHTKIYLRETGYDETDFIPCEISGRRAVDIHHIIGRGKKGKDEIENLMALTREMHLRYGDKKQFIPMLLKVHSTFMIHRHIKFNREKIQKLIDKYED